MASRPKRLHFENSKSASRFLINNGWKEVFVQTKLWRSFAGKNPKNGKPKCDPELKKSIRKLGLTYIDLWLMHWPGPGRHLNYPPVREGMSRPKVRKYLIFLINKSRYEKRYVEKTRILLHCPVEKIDFTE